MSSGDWTTYAHVHWISSFPIYVAWCRSSLGGWLRMRLRWNNLFILIAIAILLLNSVTWICNKKPIRNGIVLWYKWRCKSQKQHLLNSISSATTISIYHNDRIHRFMFGNYTHIKYYYCNYNPCTIHYKRVLLTTKH